MAAYVAKNLSVPVFAWKGKPWKSIVVHGASFNLAEAPPQLIVDDGGDATLLIRQQMAGSIRSCIWKRPLSRVYLKNQEIKATSLACCG